MVDVGPSNGYVRLPDGRLRKLKQAGDLQLLFQASGMREEKTGFHAKVEIFAEGVCVAYNTFNVERDADRVTLANSAYRQLAPTPKTELPGYPAKYLKHDLDQFCGGLQNASVEADLPSPMAGSLERRQPRFLLHPYILKDGGTILFAPPGQGKSYVLWLMAVCIDAGIHTLWQVVQSKVLVVNLERSRDSVADRLGNVNHVLGLPRDRPIHTRNARGKTLESVAPAIRRYVEQEGIECILLDSLSRAGKGSLVEDDVVNAYCDLLNSFGCSWLALAHSPRADDSHVFGSQMFDAAGDLMVKLASYTRVRDGQMGISLDVTKKNDIGPQPLWVGSLAFDSAGLLEARRALRGEFPSLEGGQVLPPEERIVRYLLTRGAASATTVSRDLGLNRSNVSAMLNTNGRFKAVKKDGRDMLFGVSGDDVLPSAHARATHPAGQHMGNTSDDDEEAI